MKSFACDYRCPPHPAVVQAVADACACEVDESYGEDRITAEATATIRRWFNEDIYVCYVSNGTAANRLALQTLLKQAYSSVICTEGSHINTAEAGAIESLGYKVLPIPDQKGKLDTRYFAPLLSQRDDIHLTYPQVLSLSNATEVGTVYHRSELMALGLWATANNFAIHIDGARLLYAAAHLEVGNLSYFTFDTGASAVSLGATKCGGMMGDAVIFKDPQLAEVARRLQKQQGQLSARTHVLAAQFGALFKDGLAFSLADNANRMTQRLAHRCQTELDLGPASPVESNALFVRLQPDVIDYVLAETTFYVWDRAQGIVRLMCSWDTTEKDVDELVELIKRARRQ